MSSSWLREVLRKRREKALQEAMRAAKKLIEALEREGLRISEAYLFGSRVRGDSLEHSDVDLLLVSRDWEGVKFSDRLDQVYRVEWREGISPWVEVIPLTPRELKEKLNQFGMIRSASRYWLRIK